MLPKFSFFYVRRELSFLPPYQSNYTIVCRIVTKIPHLLQKLRNARLLVSRQIWNENEPVQLFVKSLANFYIYKYIDVLKFIAIWWMMNSLHLQASEAKLFACNRCQRDAIFAKKKYILDWLDNMWTAHLLLNWQFSLSLECFWYSP